MLYLFSANLGGSACSSEIVQAISAVRHFGSRSGMIRRADFRNWLHFYRIQCRLSIIGWVKVLYVHAYIIRQGRTQGGPGHPLRTYPAPTFSGFLPLNYVICIIEIFLRKMWEDRANMQYGSGFT